MSTVEVDAGRGEAFLIRLRKALSNAYSRIKEQQESWGERLSFAMKIFTDNIVIGYPLRDPGFNQGEPELGHILSIFSELQIVLAMEGFFLRGGIACGDHYMDDDIVFGPALLEAVKKDKRRTPPRIVLSASSVELLRRQLGFYASPEVAPHIWDLMEDENGVVFLNYLSEAFMAFPDQGVFLELIQRHKQAVEAGLKAYEKVPDIRSKYEWAARYHNHVCRDFAARFPVPDYATVNEEFAAACEDAQRLLDYLIDIEEIRNAFRRLTLSPIPPRRR